ncbi:Beta-galactosidase 8 [Datura stramonium]|uniref:Beta-galactosidase 8 n=1 Tax=Datura stramonium TaxID=4076 RepID=A0ABS8TKA0_DATST|nr:Beta-galactosidase 8 [Datura stramonium]
MKNGRNDVMNTFACVSLWLHFIPGIEFRTDNEPFKIENEYGNGDIESRYGPRAKPYVNWAASMTTSLDTGVPWVMCQQPDAPAPIISRSIGDVCLKKSEFNREPLYAKFCLREPFGKPILSSDRAISVHHLQPHYQFIIFASNSL